MALSVAGVSMITVLLRTPNHSAVMVCFLSISGTLTTSAVAYGRESAASVHCR
jgi:hypothetical protein